LLEELRQANVSPPQAHSLVQPDEGQRQPLEAQEQFSAVLRPQAVLPQEEQSAAPWEQRRARQAWRQRARTQRAERGQAWQQLLAQALRQVEPLVSLEQPQDACAQPLRPHPSQPFPQPRKLLLALPHRQ
jgi:hypothetical protein